MNKVKFLKIFCFILIAAIITACAGCASTTPTSIESQVSFSEGDGPLTPYAETLTVTQVRSRDPNVSFIEGEDAQNNFITKLYKEKLNIIWSSNWETDPNAYTAKLNLDIASNDLPDVFKVTASQLKTLIASDQIQDLTAVYDHYVSDRLRDNIGYNDKLLLKIPTVDGKLYGIPVTTGYEGDIGFMWLRTDWMQQLNLTPPTTFDEFTDYIATVKESGIANVKGSKYSGLSFLGAGSVSFDCIAQTESAYYDYWLKDPQTDSLVYGSIQPGMRAALLKMQKMYADGLIDRDFAVKESTEQESIAKGQYGIVFGQYWYPALLKASVMNNRDATWNAYPLPANLQGVVKPRGTNFTSGYIVVKKGYEHPEAAIKSMNLWIEVWGDGGLYREWYTDQMTTTYKDISVCGEYALPVFLDGVLTQINIGKYVRAAYATSNPSETIKQYPYARMTWSYLEDESSPRFIPANGWLLKHIYTDAERVLVDDYKDIQFNEFQGVLSDDSVFLKTTLDKTMVETFTNIIMGDPIEKFDSFVTEWKSQGGDEIAVEVNEWYAGQKK